MFRLLLTGLILYQVICSLQSDECYLLSLVCAEDPNCNDHQVFYRECLTKKESIKEDLPQGIIDEPVRWADKDNPGQPVYIENRKIGYNDVYNNVDDLRNKQVQNLKDIYSDYQRESIRESLLLLKHRLHEQKDDTYINRQYVDDHVGIDINHGDRDINHRSVDENVIRNSLDTDIRKADETDITHKHVNTNTNHDSLDTRIIHKSTDTNVNHKYVHQNNNNEHDDSSVNSKYMDINRKLSDSIINHKLIDTSIGSKSDDTTINHKSLGAVGNHKPDDDHVKKEVEVLQAKHLVNKDISGPINISSGLEEKKSNIINKAFDLVQTLINERETHDSDILFPSDVATDKVKRKVLPEDSEQLLDGPATPVVHDKPNVINTGIDRSEVAVPVYTRSDGDMEHKGKEKDLGVEEDRGLLVIETSDSLSDQKAVKVGKVLQNLLWNITNHKVFHFQSVENENNGVYLMKINTSWFKFNDNAVLVAKKINTDDTIRTDLSKHSGAVILSAESIDKDVYAESHVRETQQKSWDQLTLFSAVIAASVLGLLFAAIVVCIIKRKGKSLTPLIFKRQEAVQDYQELCRTQMSVANSPRPEEEIEKNGTMKTWNDEQSPYNMDITTGHVILAYMEDHLKNENRLNKEWEALCSYKADENETLAGSDIKHATKNRYRDVLPYDHTRVKLHQSSNAFHSDYINASFITDTDPRNPSYIATQGPLDNTVADFWQMIWEQGVVVIINLTKLSDMGLPQCHHYWPLDGSEIYHIYEVHLISEHIWCDDYLVRSLYLKNLQTAETRTVTQFHYLTWPDLSIPSSPKPLLEFRRKVNKCYRGHACPVVVHCNNGVGRTGTYILLDMVLNKMIKGTKEIDIAATLEHLRDQRQDFVKTKGQFEFALLAVAEEVTSILSAVAR